MKILSVVGIRKSGKTTTVEILIEELKKRGFTVGTVKTINCPMFEIEESEKSNTRRHKMAGADVVCASAKGETTFIYSEGLGQNRIFGKMQVDYLILEGDYQSDVPRIICAHEAEEIPPRITKDTFLVSGRIADRLEQVHGFPAVSALKDRALLVQKVIEAVKDTTLPVTFSPIPKEAITFCQHACKKACERAAIPTNMYAATRSADAGDDSRLPRHIFLTGEKQIGKSTIWNKVLDAFHMECQGFRTYPFELNGEKKGYYMHAIGTVPEKYYNDIPVAIRSGARGVVPVTEAFDTFGADILLEAVKGEKGLILLDELGKMERDAFQFQNAVKACLDSTCVVLGVLQKTGNPFIQEIKERPDVSVYEVTEENRDALPEELISVIKNRMMNAVK